MNRPELPPASHTRTLWVLRVGVAAALAVSAVIHVQLAPGYQRAAPGGLGQGTLFLVQAGAAALAAVFVLLRGSRTDFAAAAVVDSRPWPRSSCTGTSRSLPSGRCRRCTNRSGTQPRPSRQSPKRLPVP